MSLAKKLGWVIVALPLLLLLLYIIRPTFNFSGVNPVVPLLPITVSVPVSGTGSMFPTVPKGNSTSRLDLANEIVTVMKMYPFSATPSGLSKLTKVTRVNRGDIVSFTNSKVAQIEMEEYGKAGGLIKRAIGLPGETLEIRDGLVYVNGIALKEPYTAQPHSTFGGDFLPECQPLVIPPDQVFVMGDNRKASDDSRHQVGLIKLTDIDLLLPWNRQKGTWDKNFRDTGLDLDPSSKIITDKTEYLHLINQQRLAAGAKELVYQPLLEKSALIRAENILQYNDFSFTATRSGLTQKKAMDRVGYWQPLWGETWRLGYYTADELLENQLAFPESREFILNPKFSQVGIGVFQGSLNNCPAQLLVVHYAGYVPPDYSAEMVKSWTDTLSALRQTQSGWQELKKYPSFYDAHKSEVDRINEIVAARLNRLPPIVEKITKNQWLSPGEEKYLDQDLALAREQNSLADRLNSY
jgi:signal peptidase I